MVRASIRIHYMRKLLLLLLFFAQTAIAADKPIGVSQKGVANGVATLDGSSTVPLAQVPLLPFTKLTGAPVVISGTSIDFTVGNFRTITLSADTTFTFSNGASVPGRVVLIKITNTVGNFTVTWPTMKWPGGVAPTQTVGARFDLYSIFYDGTQYVGSYVQNY